MIRVIHGFMFCISTKVIEKSFFWVDEETIQRLFVRHKLKRSIAKEDLHVIYIMI